LVPQEQFAQRSLSRRAVLSLCAFLLCCSIGAWTQSAAFAGGPASALRIRATHLMGFPNTKSNCNGTLLVKEDTLRFRQDGKSDAELKIPSIQGAFLGGESKQVGGVPMKVGKAATPFGGGRVISLFAHKKYDTLTVEYVDNDGGVHGAIFQLSKGEAELVRSELVAQGASLNVGSGKPAQAGSAEVSNETK